MSVGEEPELWEGEAEQNKLSRHSLQLKKNSQELSNSGNHPKTQAPQLECTVTKAVQPAWFWHLIDHSSPTETGAPVWKNRKVGDREKQLFILSSMIGQLRERVCALCWGSIGDVHSAPKQRKAGEKSPNQEVITSSERQQGCKAKRRQKMTRRLQSHLKCTPS